MLIIGKLIWEGRTEEVALCSAPAEIVGFEMAIVTEDEVQIVSVDDEVTEPELEREPVEELEGVRTV